MIIALSILRRMSALDGDAERRAWRAEVQESRSKEVSAPRGVGWGLGPAWVRMRLNWLQVGGI
jgi:hypothetical protein